MNSACSRYSTWSCKSCKSLVIRCGPNLYYITCLWDLSIWFNTDPKRHFFIYFFVPALFFFSERHGQLRHPVAVPASASVGFQQWAAHLLDQWRRGVQTAAGWGGGPAVGSPQEQAQYELWQTEQGTQILLWQGKHVYSLLSGEIHRSWKLRVFCSSSSSYYTFSSLRLNINHSLFFLNIQPIAGWCSCRPDDVRICFFLWLIGWVLCGWWATSCCEP